LLLPVGLHVGRVVDLEGEVDDARVAREPGAAGEQHGQRDGERRPQRGDRRPQRPARHAQPRAPPAVAHHEARDADHGGRGGGELGDLALPGQQRAEDDERGEAQRGHEDRREHRPGDALDEEPRADRQHEEDEREEEPAVQEHQRMRG
jgi:hypothetical protein